MLWYAGAIAISVLFGRFLTGYNEKWSWGSFAGSLIISLAIATGANGITTGVQDGRNELAATHKLALINGNSYLALGDADNGGKELRFRVDGEIDTRSANDFIIIKTTDTPKIEIYNNRTSSYWYTVFGGNQKKVLYVPNTEVVLT
jgi:hypothetical protein